MSKQAVVMMFLTDLFEENKPYTAREVNQILNTFGDVALLRRELLERNFWDKTLDGKSYWCVQSKK